MITLLEYGQNLSEINHNPMIMMVRKCFPQSDSRKENSVLSLFKNIY